MTEHEAVTLPWHEPVWARLGTAMQDGRLPHAILLTGAAGLGMPILARRLAHSIVCAQRDAAGHPCGHCRSCRLWAAGTHPDFAEVGLEEGAKDIKIDAVRGLGASLALTAQLGTGKVAVIDPADRMNAAAANALLKTLEEPPAGTWLILVTEVPSRLPATIRSRCQRFECPVPPVELARDWLARELGCAADEAGVWLALAGGAPLRAAEWAKGSPPPADDMVRDMRALRSGRGDPVAVAERWRRTEAAADWLCTLLVDMVKLQFDPATTACRHRGQRDALTALAGRIDAAELFGHLDRAYAAVALTHTTANAGLILEDWLAAWCYTQSAVGEKAPGRTGIREQ